MTDRYRRVLRVSPHGRDRRMRHVSCPFCHRSRCAATRLPAGAAFSDDPSGSTANPAPRRRHRSQFRATRPNAVSEAYANRAESASRDSTPQQDDFRHFRQRSARRTVRSSESPFSAHFQWKNAVDSKTIESDALIELDEIELAEVAGGTSNPSRPAPPPAPPIPIPYPNFTNTF